MTTEFDGKENMPGAVHDSAAHNGTSQEHSGPGNAAVKDGESVQLDGRIPDPLEVDADGLGGGSDPMVISKAPVFEVGEPAPGDMYPSVFIYARVEDEDGNYQGRAYVGHYPFAGEEDEGGWEALHFGADYYVEGMGYADSADYRTRIDCFSAAELLYLHAAEKGNPIAWLNLGYVYSYDRCEGNYYDVWEDGADPFPREERAFECFKKASDAGLAEGAYKLGDMYKHGTGCEPNAQEAFSCYTRAFELGKEDDPVIWGSVALRLADAYENGFGCEQSFAKALNWYNQAVTGLEIAVRGGDWFYKKALASARNGVVRCRQEDVG